MRTGSYLRIVLSLVVLGAASAHADDSVIAVKAKRIYSAAGEAIDGGVMLIKDGKISALGAGLAIPAGAR